MYLSAYSDATDLKLVDVNDDGDLDLLLTTLDDGINVYLGDGAGNLADPPVNHEVASSGEGSDAIGCIDADGDGKTDFIAGGYEAGYYLYLRGATTDAKLVPIGTVDTGEEEEEEEEGGGEEEGGVEFQGVYCIDVGDLDGDGDPEVVVGDDFQNYIFVYKLGNPFEE